MAALLSEIVWDEATIAIVGTFAVPLAVILAGAWYKLNKVRSDNDLKRTMIERGMSVEEIERVIAAGPRQGDA
jgi:hypothetical protein